MRKSYQKARWKRQRARQRKRTGLNMFWIPEQDEREAVEFAKYFMSDAVHETAKIFRQKGPVKWK